jgi:predicted dehydrogenase
MTQPLRFGLVGTGHWARITHAPALAATDGVEFAAVWGRNADAAADLAARYHATAHRDLAEFLAGVDAVAFAVPPDVQVPIAVRAASATAPCGIWARTWSRCCGPASGRCAR